MIRYRYGIDKFGKYIDVTGLTAERKEKSAPFYCLGCGNELIARLGTKVKKHFAHKQEVTCSHETYLHQLAKKSFATAFKDALKQGKPINLHRSVPYTCRYYESKFGFACVSEESQTIDLTKFFDKVEIERSVDNYVADVLLSSTNSNEVLLIEFAVTHPCDEAKIKSGLRIIEVKIRNEEDAFAITRWGIHPGNESVKTYNLVDKPTANASCKGDCDRKVYLFVVYGSGKVILLELSPAKAIKPNLKGEVLYSKVLGPVAHSSIDVSRRTLLRDEVRYIYFQDVKLRNCYMCRYHGIGAEDEFFCRIEKTEVPLNYAIECGKYRPMNSLSECRRKDAENDAYMSKHGRNIKLRKALNSMFDTSYIFGNSKK